MPMGRLFQTVCTSDHWRRAAYEDVSLDHDVVRLASLTVLDPDEIESIEDEQPVIAPLAFDSCKRLYRRPSGRRAHRQVPVGGRDCGREGDASRRHSSLRSAPQAGAGDFAPHSAPAGDLARPTGIAIDNEDRLFIAESGRVLVYDVADARRLRAVAFDSTPIDVAAAGTRVVVL